MITSFFRSVKNHFLEAYFRSPLQPRSTRSAAMSLARFAFWSIPLSLLGYILGWPGALLLQTVLGQVPFSGVRLFGELIYMVVTVSIIKDISIMIFTEFTAWQCSSYLRKFANSNNSEEQKKLVEKFVDLLFLSPEAVAHHFSSFFSIYRPSITSDARSNLLAHCNQFSFLSQNIERYTMDRTTKLILSFVGNKLAPFLPIHEDEQIQNRFAQLCAERLSTYFFPTIIEACLPHWERIIKEINDNEKPVSCAPYLELRKFENSNFEEQEELVKQFVDSLFKSPQFVAQGLSVYLNNNPRSFENAVERTRLLSYVLEFSFLRCYLEQYTVAVTTEFVMDTIDIGIEPFLPLLGSKQTQDEFVKRLMQRLNTDFYASIIKECLPHFEKAVTSLAEKVKKEPVSLQCAAYLDFSKFENSSPEDREKLVEQFVDSLFISPDVSANMFGNSLGLLFFENSKTIKNAFLKHCETQVSLAAAIEGYTESAVTTLVLHRLTRVGEPFLIVLGGQLLHFCELFDKRMKTYVCPMIVDKILSDPEKRYQINKKLYQLTENSSLNFQHNTNEEISVGEAPELQTNSQLSPKY